MLFAFAACSEEAESAYSFEGVQDVHLAKSATEYDFAEGVTGFKDLAATEFTVDASGVQFGTAGKYEVIYKIDSYEARATVYIYDMPVFEQTSSEISYADAQTDDGLKKGITAKDTFGNSLEITVKQGISAGSGGYIEYGKHNVVYTATDRVGNVAEYTREVTVSEADRPQFAAITIDLADIEVATEIGGGTLVKILFDGEELAKGDYTFTNGILAFSSEFILKQELGEHELFIATSAGYASTKLNLTDALPADFTINVSDMEYQESVALPKAQLNGNQRNITFEYVLKGADGTAYSLTDAGETLTFAPGAEKDFSFTVNAKRGTEPAGSKSFDFQIFDDVFAFVANPVNTNTFYKEGFSAVYTTEQHYGTDAGSMYVTNTGVQDRGNVCINLHNVPAVPAQSSLVFYLYNPTGAELTAEIYTTSGYWDATRLQIAGVLTERVTVPAEAGWHKVVLPFDPGFDGNFVNMSSETADSAESQLRIFTADWQWSGEENFGVYLSNIYEQVDHTLTQVTYNEAGFSENGLVGTAVTLPEENTQDGRVQSEYDLQKEGQPVDSWDGGFSFIPEEEGTYTYTIITYWRDTKIAEKEYTFTVNGAVALPAEPSYKYDFNTGAVTLPEAIVSGALEGNTIRYSVTPAEGGEAAVLGADRVYTCPKVGSYVYKAEVLGEQSAVVDSAEVTIRLEPSNVLIGFGQDPASADPDRTLGWNVNTGTTFTYTPDIAREGEIGSLRINNDGNTGGERGNIGLNLRSTDITSYDRITFWVYVAADVQLGVNLYSLPTWMFSHYWYNGTLYTDMNVYPIQGSAEGGWHKIEFYTATPSGVKVSGDDIRLTFKTDSEAKYPWQDGKPAEIYISNIYCEILT